MKLTNNSQLGGVCTVDAAISRTTTAGPRISQTMSWQGLKEF
jgi:hypothetical protein